MCELEQHVMMLRESGGPLSASRILSHMRSINCQIGDGSQEDAHEFLRFFFFVLSDNCGSFLLNVIIFLFMLISHETTIFF